jgi:hypothetical protein
MASAPLVPTLLVTTAVTAVTGAASGGVGPAGADAAGHHGGNRRYRRGVRRHGGDRIERKRYRPERLVIARDRIARGVEIGRHLGSFIERPPRSAEYDAYCGRATHWTGL